MTTHPTHDEPVTPFWQVQSVFDPDGTGKDFAYTIGLHERGLPELHIWARPSLGDDPGHDWMLSNADRCRVLNELAGLSVAGGIGIGSEVRREYDNGHARVTYRIDPPGDREQLEAFGIAPGAQVLPVLWSLEREPEGEIRPLDALARRRAQRLYDEIVAGLDGQVTAPPGWALPVAPDFGEGQRFGPLTPVVLARAAQLWQADDETMAELLHAVCTLAEGRIVTAPATVAMALARPVGRRTALVAVHEAVHDLVERVTTHPAGRKRWRGILRSFDPAWWSQLDREGRRNLDHNLGGCLHDLTLACLSVEAVADVADGALLLEGRGAWLSGIRHEAMLSLPAWQASPVVQDAVRGLLGSLDLRGLTGVGAGHAVALRGGVSDYYELCARLQSWALVSAAACPWESLLAQLPGWQPVRDAVPGAVLGPMLELHQWATCLTAALTHRARLSAADVRTFTAPHLALLPKLPALLNSPL